MAKLTLLEMTQNILSAMDSDVVNSIDDTEESIQVAETVKESYYELCSIRDWPFLRTLTAFEGVYDTDNPTFMRMPTNMNKVLWVKYHGNNVTYMDPKDFKDMIDARTELADVVSADGYILNADPQYWTTYDDNIVVFDGLNLADEITDTLHESKSDVYGVVAPSWTHEDDFIPTLPEKMFPTLLADAKGSCFLNLKQQANAKEESRAKRGRTRAQNEAWRADAGETGTYSTTTYGRK